VKKTNYKIIKNSTILKNQNYPIIDVAVTFFNHENIVLNILSSVTNNCKYSFNLIVLDDKSEDKTLVKILEFMKKVENKQINNWEKIFSIMIIQSTKQLNFETICSNIHMNFTLTKHLMYLQVDQIILEKDIDAKLIKVMEKNEEIF
jgi:glycosyltransferase involved in cell wall biosynthesis